MEKLCTYSYGLFFFLDLKKTILHTNKMKKKKKRKSLTAYAMAEYITFQLKK